MGPGQSFPPLSILSSRRGLPAWRKCRERGWRDGGWVGCSGRADTPPFPAPTSQDDSEPWGRRDGGSLHRRGGNRRTRSGEAGRKAAQGERGGGARGPTCSGACWQGGSGVPRRTGEALSARFRIPLASGVDCCKRHGLPLGPRAHWAPALASPPFRQQPRLGQRVQAAPPRTEGGGGRGRGTGV